MDWNELDRRLRTVVVTTVTPFTAAGDLDLDAVERHTKWLIEAGVRALVPCGNTGEFASLHPAEAKQVVAATVDAAAGSTAVVVAGVGGPSRTAVELARHAAEVGADAIMVHHPAHPYIDRRAVRAYFERVLTATDLGVILYKRGPEVTDELITELVRHDQVVAVKYAVGDVSSFAELVDATDPSDCVWLCGIAERWAPFFAVAGASGFTSGIANFAPGEALGLHAALAAGDYERARVLRRRIAPFERLRSERFNANNVPAVKEAMAQLGLGSRSVRDPLAELDPDDRQAVSRILRDWELLP